MLEVSNKKGDLFVTRKNNGEMFNIHLFTAESYETEELEKMENVTDMENSYFSDFAFIWKYMETRNILLLSPLFEEIKEVCTILSGEYIELKCVSRFLEGFTDIETRIGMTEESDINLMLNCKITSFSVWARFTGIEGWEFDNFISGLRTGRPKLKFLIGILGPDCENLSIKLY